MSESVGLTFYGYNIFVPYNSSLGTILLKNLQEIKVYNFTKNDILRPDYIYRIADITQKVVQEQNISAEYHEGSFSNIAVMDTHDNYVSLVRYVITTETIQLCFWIF